MLFLYKFHAYWSVNAVSGSLAFFDNCAKLTQKFVFCLFVFCLFLFLSGIVQIWGHPFFQAFWKQPAAFIQGLSAVYLDCMWHEMGPRPCTGEFIFFDVNCFAGKLAITENASCTFSVGPTFYTGSVLTRALHVEMSCQWDLRMFRGWLMTNGFQLVKRQTAFHSKLFRTSCSLFSLREIRSYTMVPLDSCCSHSQNSCPVNRIAIKVNVTYRASDMENEKSIHV